MKSFKGLKKAAAILTALIVLGTAGAVFAATYKTPVEIVSGLTGKSTDELIAAREAGKTYGTIANEAGKLEEFKTQMLEQKKAILDQRVKDGTLTQERATEIYNAIKANQANCDGTGSSRTGMRLGAGFGNGSGTGLGDGTCTGTGSASGKGAGMGAGRGMGRGLNR